MSGSETRQVQSLRELSQDVAPARDLWPSIAPQLAPRSAWVFPASLAAAVLLAVLGSVIAWRMHEATPSTAQPASSGLIRAALMSDPLYQSHREALLFDVDRKLKNLSPSSQRRVRDSLQAVQTAMQTIETELGKESGNALLQELLISICQEEMRVLTAINAVDGTNQEI